MPPFQVTRHHDLVGSFLLQVQILHMLAARGPEHLLQKNLSQARSHLDSAPRQTSNSATDRCYFSLCEPRKLKPNVSLEENQ